MKSDLSSKPKRSNLSLVFSVLVLFFGSAALAFVILQGQWVVDQLRVLKYQPDSRIVKYVERAGLNDQGKFYLYAAQPAVLDSQNFNESCKDQEQETAILGCYNNGNIYIYDIDGAELDGIKEVTTAHEMLHVAYERLTSKERASVDDMIEREYKKLVEDKDLQSRMEFYRRTEPGQRDNELHAIIGTEVKSIDPELEKYYQKYFSDRSKTTTLYAKYINVFNQIDVRRQQLKSDAEALLAQVNQLKSAYERSSAQLQTDYQIYQNLAKSGGYSSQSVADRAFSALQARNEGLKSERLTIIDMINHYNLIIKELNELATRRNELTKSLDSNLDQAPSF
ncbi:MAG: hypothetical protein WBB94_01925 [Candidatus Saccharimonadaceae bacterium]